jgi:acyl dehydratase
MILAFSAGIGETSVESFDDTASGFAASPMFCASLEWRLVVAARNTLLGVAPEEARRAVHTGQDSRFLRPVRAGRAVRMDGEILGVRATRAGALSSTRLTVTDAESGVLLSTSVSRALYRGVAVEGEDRPEAPTIFDAPPTGESTATVETNIPLDRGFAHRYSECAGIWNPIHTERAVAREAGLPDIIIHGTAIWALAGRTLIERYSPNRSLLLRRLSGRFSAMVPAASAITVRHARLAADPGRVIFTVLNAEGNAAVSEGVAEFDAA